MAARNGSVYSRCCGYNWPVIKAIVFDESLFELTIDHCVTRNGSPGPLMICLNRLYSLLLRTE